MDTQSTFTSLSDTNAELLKHLNRIEKRKSELIQLYEEKISIIEEENRQLKEKLARLN